MLCEKCGSSIQENTRICPYCGTPIRGEEQNITETSTYEGSLGNPTPVLVWGIVGLSFALSFYLSFLGIIFSAIAKGKVKQFLAEGGVLAGKAKIGSILATVGLILGIIFTVIFAIVIIGLIVAAVSNSGHSRIYW